LAVLTLKRWKENEKKMWIQGKNILYLKNQITIIRAWPHDKYLNMTNRKEHICLPPPLNAIHINIYHAIYKGYF
jgi:hypothetical protein